MEKRTRLSIPWFYNLLQAGEGSIVDFKEALSDRYAFGKSLKSYSSSYDELAKDVVAFANYKGGFLFLGIVDKTREVNAEFEVSTQKLFDLIRQIQDRTSPTITVTYHVLKVDGKDLVVLEIPFSNQLHCTTKGEYLIRSNDGNRAIEPHEMETILAEKNQIIYDRKIWKFDFASTETDKHGSPVPGWQDIDKLRTIWGRLQNEQPKSAKLKTTNLEFAETLGLIREERDTFYPTTAGILFTGNKKALREFPYNQIKYIRYEEGNSYTPYEYTGDLITIADQCFAQLKSEIKTKEMHFGLFREYIEDYPEVVLRELLINSIAHRDYSRHQIIEIRKYGDYIEFESPGGFPPGITSENYLRKTNPRNPSIMDVFREIGYAEKAGSGFDKIFTALLSKGKNLPEPTQTDHSLIFRVEANVQARELIELNHYYKQQSKQEPDLEVLLVLNAIYSGKKMTFKELLEMPHLNPQRLKNILERLLELELIETTGKTSGIKYLIHKSRLLNAQDERQYLQHKKQEKFKQTETILRYLEEFGEIDNQKIREVLNLDEHQASYVSRLLKEMVEKEFIHVADEPKHNHRIYKKGPDSSLRESKSAKKK